MKYLWIRSDNKLRCEKLSERFSSWRYIECCWQKKIGELTGEHGNDNSLTSGSFSACPSYCFRFGWTVVDTVDEIFQDGGRRFGTIFAKFYENVHLWDSLRADNKCWIFNWLFFLLQTEFEEELASTDAAKCGESMESRAKSRGRVEENRTATKRVGGRESSGRDAETCCAARNSQVSEERKELLWIWRQLLKLDSLS